MRSRAIVIVLLVAVGLCALASVGSAGMRAVSPILVSSHGAQGAGLVWSGNGNAPTSSPTQSISIRQHFANLLDLVDQITRPSWRHFPGQGWWGDLIQLDL